MRCVLPPTYVYAMGSAWHPLSARASPWRFRARFSLTPGPSGVFFGTHATVAIAITSNPAPNDVDLRVSTPNGTARGHSTQPRRARPPWYVPSALQFAFSLPVGFDST